MSAVITGHELDAVAAALAEAVGKTWQALSLAEQDEYRTMAEAAERFYGGPCPYYEGYAA